MSAAEFTQKEIRISDKEMTQFTRQEVCRFGSALCQTILEESGNHEYHGGIHPGNIRISEDQSVSFLGKGNRDNWSDAELYFAAPELFWGEKCTPASDVYSIGLLMYFCISGGHLPFDEMDISDAMNCRMKGEPFEVPQNAGARLGEIIRKATEHQIDRRYAGVRELKILLDSCLENQYVEGAVSGASVFGKQEEQLSAVERMMLGIISASDRMDLGFEEKTEEEQPRQEETEKQTEETVAEEETPAAETAPEEPYFVVSPEDVAAPITAKERKKAWEIEAAVEDDLTRPIQAGYIKNTEREKKIAERVKRRRQRSVLIVASLAILLVSIALLVNASKGFSIFSKNRVETNIIFVEVTPAISVEATVIAPDYVPDPTPTPVPTPTPEIPIGTTQAITNIIRATTPPPEITPAPVMSTYEVFMGDVSWTEAKARCEARGGHLVVISSQEEFNTVVNLIRGTGADYVWIGCSRVNGELEWVNGEKVDFWKWDKNEPSGVDSGTGDVEDYVMLWNHGNWCYNDMIENPANPYGEYAAMYCGNTAYVCEYGN